MVRKMRKSVVYYVEQTDRFVGYFIGLSVSVFVYRY